MLLTKKTSIDQITVMENGIILIRKVTSVMEDGVELSKIYDRTSLTPGSSLTNQPDNVAAIASAVWTPQVVAAFVNGQLTVV